MVVVEPSEASEQVGLVRLNTVRLLEELEDSPDVALEVAPMMEVDLVGKVPVVPAEIRLERCLHHRHVGTTEVGSVLEDLEEQEEILVVQEDAEAHHHPETVLIREVPVLASRPLEVLHIALIHVQVHHFARKEVCSTL